MGTNNDSMREAVYVLRVVYEQEAPRAGMSVDRVQHVTVERRDDRILESGPVSALPLHEFSGNVAILLRDVDAVRP